MFRGYDPGPFYDEMFFSDGQARPHYARMYEELASITAAHFEERRQLADLSFLLQGITFTVYSDGRGTERLFPFDLIPRILPVAEWDRIERGLGQRVMALNLFLQDIYGPQRILKDRRVPRSLIYSCRHFRREMIGVQVPGGIYTHVAGIDLVRDSRTGDFLVLEDNVRTPSGISYVLENRLVMTRTFPHAFHQHPVRPVDHYPQELCQILRSLSPRGAASPVIVLLTPGIRDALGSGSGVCQDFAHLLLALLRMRNLPARYVSGYLMPRRTAEPGANAEEVIGGQASHAWVEVYLPGAGWFGLDPTLGSPVSLQHVRVAYGRDYGDVAPVRGVYKGHAGQRLSVDVEARPALDNEGWEHLPQTNAAPPQAALSEEPQQQEQQQQ